MGYIPLRFFANATDGAACTGRIIERATIVVTELHDDIITFIQIRLQYLFPSSSGNERAAASFANGMIVRMPIFSLYRNDRLRKLPQPH